MVDATAGKPERGGADPLTITAFFAAFLLVLFPIFRFAFVPFADLPQHVALAQLLRHIGDPEVTRLYAADLFPQVNILALLVMALLFVFVPEGLGVALIVALYVAGLAYALTRLSSALGVSRANAVLALLFALNFNLLYGFMSFCLGIPAMVLILARLAAVRDRAGGRALLADTALWLILALAHALLFAFALCASFLWLALSKISPGFRLRRLAAAVPALLLTLGWLFFGGGGEGRGMGSELKIEWHGLGEKLDGIGWSTIVARADDALGWTVLCAAVGSAISLLVMEVVVRGRKPGTDSEHHRSRMRLWVRLCALMAAALYLVLPYAIVSAQFVTRGVFLLYNRYAVLAAVLLIASLAWPRSRGFRRLGLSAALVLHIALAWHWSGLLGRVSGEARGLDGAIEVMEPGGIVKSLIFTPYSDVIDFPAYLHAGSYYQARKLGETDQSFALLPSTPVHYRDPERPYLSQLDEHLAPHLFDWRRAGLYDYILIYDRGGEWAQFHSPAPFPRIYEQNGWAVLDIKNRGR
jgi:hypothetical protein